ncbi:MAG TPA: carbon-nitrogen hydrolase family protein [Erwinia persicina]|uniref:carbon-nitrogen hydrolase family protein n=1 Tax=Erwinia persicina TaxID=55211 RepID=UPI000786F317|nr:carbon-nitrogen hydrolase family protein [Erwinia persicina]AXU94933.1 carbon-nitrogen hydrolase family protein [Erwinia persicina]MBD8167006.1 carbon-nitrogen hydrolase family protein [Erwinia persicina]QZQ51970.1 carbon-nitrogen hydrolase family protein [Erwinia persicina]HBH68545.1 carbon-nitrogen hydrolase family protein [Erwinia persicina]HBI08476.1 carbon-nitrogen hydrolase family protein [Erwinia persicina]
MSQWTIAAAQSGSRPGDLSWNIQHHLDFVEQAATQGVDLLMFPELSLTGYELPLVADLALSVDDALLHPFAVAAQEHQMGISIGLPLKADDNVRLSALTFLPDGTRIAYSKRNLFGPEKEIFTPGNTVPIFGYQHHQVAMAICADISVEEFARDASVRGADLYATSVLVSEKGYDTDCGHLARWSREYKMAVLMANHAWPTGGYQCAGKSAFWDAQGHQVIRGGEGEQLIIARRDGNHWQGEAHSLPCPSVL